MQDALQIHFTRKNAGKEAFFQVLYGVGCWRGVWDWGCMAGGMPG